MLTRPCSLWSTFCLLWKVAELIEEHLGSSRNRWPHFLSSRYFSVFTESNHAPHPHSEAFTPSPVSPQAIIHRNYGHQYPLLTPSLSLHAPSASPSSALCPAVSSAHRLPTPPICLSFLQILPPLKMGFYPENSWEVDNISGKCTG